MKPAKQVGLTVRRLVNKTRRELLHLPIVSTIAARNYEIRKTEYRPYLPGISDENQEIINEIRRKGVCVTNTVRLNASNTSAMLSTAEQFFKEPERFFGNSSRQSIPNRILQHHPDLYLWGLEEQLLALVENYLELPALYLGAEVKIEPADGNSTGVRQWHIDIEDYRMIKIIIYLSDVEPFDGPFEYISRTQTQRFVQTTGYRAGLIDDATMLRSIPQDQWIVCSGLKHTVVITDPCSVLHRVKTPSQRDRHSVTFNYCSRFPFEFRSKNALRPEPEILTRLSARQLQCAIR
jgi:hypothetical protein